MKSMKTITTFLGWCTVINFSFLLLAFFGWTIIQDPIAELGAKAFGVTVGDVKVTLLRVLLQYRAGIVLLNFVPWIALKIMARTAPAE
jgi:tetrahydromethanopterin S-methyltransferase subunit E